MTFWKDLCGVRNVSVWSENDFGQCFSDLAFIVASHILFAVCSSFQLGTHQVTYRQSVYNTNRTYFKIVIIRLVISIFLAALSAIEIIVLSLQKVHLEIIDYTTNAVVFIAWLLHAGALWKLRLLPVNRGRGPITLIVTWILTLFAICIQLRSAILNLTGELHNLQTVEIIVIIIVGCLQCLYLISLVPPFTAPIDLSLYSSINDTDGAREPLLASSGQQLLGIAEDNANCFSKLAFWWVNPLMLKGSKGCLNSTEDLFLLPRKLQTEYVSAMFVKAWKKPIIVSGEVEGSIQEVKNTSVSDESEGVFIPSVEFSHTDSKTKNTNMKSTTLLMGMHNMLGCRYYSLGLLKLFSDGLNFAGPLLLHALVSYMENRDEPVQNGYYYAGALFLTTSITALSSVHFNYLVNKVSLEMRVALVTSVYHKTLSVGTTALSKFATGEIVNLMSTDVDRVRNFAISFHAFWSLPFTVAIALFLLYLQVGLSFLVGVGVMVVLIPLNHCIARKIGKLNQSLMKKKDARVKMMSEVLFGIRVIKFFAWEKHFGDRIKSLRSDELQSLKGIKYLDAFCVYFWATTPVLISLLTFTTYAALGNTLTAAKVFTCVALFNMLVVPLNAFPWVLNGLMEAWVSMNRLQTFMDLQELNLCLYYEQGPSEEDIDTYVSIKKSSFHWEWHLTTTDEKSTGDVQVTGDSNSALSVDGRILKLTDINLEVRKGQLIGIIGRVGSGKSSLLSAITGEMNKDSGELWVDDLPGGFGLVTQESWIQHDTVKDNILFGEPFNVYKYDAVLDACALKEDMKILPAGDETEIGENGVTLSGGQKARISLARAVYQNKDVYLLDDPLAAVDTHVAVHLFQQCIVGLLGCKTRILCTHHTQYLQDADLVVVMEEGRIVNSGLPSEILRSTDSPVVSKTEKKAEVDDDLIRIRHPSFIDIDLNKQDQSSVSKDIETDGTLVKDEEKEIGVVRFHVYHSYWKAIGNCLASCILLSLLLMQASRNINDWWLSYWVTHSQNNSTAPLDINSALYSPVINSYEQITSPPYAYTLTPTGFHHLSVSLHRASSYSAIEIAKDSSLNRSVSFYLTVYGCLAAANSIFTFFRAFLFAYGGICAAKVIHSRLISSILKAPVVFFDVTPIGRIINRFSSDMYEIDDTLPFVLNILLAQMFSVLGTIVITCYGLPWFTVLLLPLIVFYYFIQRYYRRTSRELKRLSSVTLSPIYAHFTETLTGLMTIRALRATDRFATENKERLETNQKAQFCSFVANQWLAVRLQLLAVTMVTGVAFIAVLEHHFQTVNPGLVGLSISYALSITSLLSGVITMFTETEKEMVSVERAVQYTEDTPKETNDGILQPPPTWPEEGCISFHCVYMAYRPGLPNALNGVSFNIESGEKIGIVGRTGSGKSSLLLTLFRMVQIQSGSITIDGFNIGHLALDQLRSRIAIIPQDSFLFSGSIKENLDPTQQHSDTQLWRVLEKCHLKKVVDNLGGLEADVAERGKHFSVGQRQLVCLARAMLTRARVLCIDEATASVDLTTDELLQETIREEFRHHTVLTIAHRINTILDSDRVIVMSHGKVAEFASPDHLLANRHSLFYSLVNRHT